MRILAKAFAISFLVLLLCGCWNKRELNDLGVVLGMGIDKGKTPGTITVTTQVEKTSSTQPKGDMGGAPPQPYINVTNVGTDLFSIIRDYNSELTRKLYFPHTQIIIFGEEFARDGISTQIDLMLRDPEFRLTVLMLVTKGTAEDMLNVDARLESSPSIDLSNMIEAQENTSECFDVNLFDFLSAMVSPTRSQVIPLAKLEKDGEKNKSVMAGAAVFKDDRMVGELNGIETRGLLWVLGEVKSGIINFDAEDGPVSLEIIKATSKVRPEILKDGTPLIHVKITETGNLGSQSGRLNQSTPSALKRLEKQKTEIIKAEALHTIILAQQMGADIFGFGDKFGQYYPNEWDKMEKDWSNLFKTLQVDVEVKATLKATGKLTMPAFPLEEYPT